MNRRYKNYIRSKKWQEKRLKRLTIDGYTCRTCNAKQRLEIHHTTYERFGNERMGDLITLCHDCHKAITYSIRWRRRKKKLKKSAKKFWANFKTGVGYCWELLLS